MTILEQLNSFCRRLWRDESGVVLAFTVIVFLTLFVIACSVYAVGENIRQRIVLQNAADAAAYSGAVVQADALSRIAAINKALAWTYVQMGRAVMDYDVDVWLEWTIKKWHARDNDVNKWVHQPGANCPYYWVGLNAVEGQILINEQPPPCFIWYLENVYNFAPNHYWNLKPRIDRSRTNIIEMNAAEVRIMDGLQENIRRVVTNVLQRNVGTDSDYWYSCISTPPSQYFRVLSGQKDEQDHLLGFLEPFATLASAFGDGVDTWFKQVQASDGIQRHYEQQDSCLRAEWQWFGIRWWPCLHNPCCMPEFYHNRLPFGQEPDDIVTGAKAKAWGGHPQAYYETEKVKAQILTDTYFKSFQHIVVAVARKMDNPLAFMFQSVDPTKPGLFGFFEPIRSNGKPPYAWAVATSRAGYRKDRGGEGEYWTADTDGSWLPSRWNLSECDWDAVLIPVLKTDGTQILPALWDSSDWWGLYGAGQANGLGSLAAGAAPTATPLH